MLTILEISSYAYAKIAAYQANTSNESSGFAVFNDQNQVIDFRMVQHEATTVSIEFDEDAQDAYALEQVMAGNKRLVINLWWHTHPCGPSSSGVDDNMFSDMKSDLDVAIMLIYGNDDTFSCRMAVRAQGFTLEQELKVRINANIAWPEIVEGPDEWRAQVKELCIPKKFTPITHTKYAGQGHNHVPRAPLPELYSEDWWDKDDTDLAELEKSFYEAMKIIDMPEAESSGVMAGWDHAIFNIIPLSEDVNGEFDLVWIAGYDAAWRKINIFAKFRDEKAKNATAMTFVDVA